MPCIPNPGIYLKGRIQNGITASQNASTVDVANNYLLNDVFRENLKSAAISCYTYGTPRVGNTQFKEVRLVRTRVQLMRFNAAYFRFSTPWFQTASGSCTRWISLRACHEARGPVCKEYAFSEAFFQ